MTTIVLPGAKRSVNGAVCAPLPSNLAVAFDSTTDRASASALPDLRTMARREALERLDRLIEPAPGLEALRDRAIKSAVDAGRRVFDEDTLFAPRQSRLTSASTSLQRREGSLLQATFVHEVSRTDHLVLVPSERLAVCRNVADHIERLGHEGCADVDLRPDGPQLRAILPDVCLVDARRNVGWLLELKRGAQLGAQHAVRLADDVAAAGLLAKDHLKSRGYDVRGGRSAVLVFREDAGLRVPTGLAMPLTDFDAQFGTQVARSVEIIRRVHAQAARLVLYPLQAAALAEADMALAA